TMGADVAGERIAKHCRYRRILKATCERQAHHLRPGSALCYLAHSSHAERAAEAACGIVRLRAVVVHEHLAIAAVAEQCPAECAHITRCLDPAGSLRIEFAELLQLLVLFLRQQVDAHCGSHLDSIALRLVLLP